ncbi:MAG: winged helix-turn-helix domain-containing protein [Lachnospiraceae bacterium]|nr:winged helix-turn-helix domain-containing protein [Lachnospiraceae bacterium]
MAARRPIAAEEQNPADAGGAKVRRKTSGAGSDPQRDLRGASRARLRSDPQTDSQSGSRSCDGISLKNGKAYSFQEVCDLTVDELSLEITCNGTPLKLTRTEYAILRLLLGNPNRNLAKSVILDRIAAETPDCTEDSLKQHISHIRTKLEQAGSGMKVESVWGIGYRLTARQ